MFGSERSADECYKNKQTFEHYNIWLFCCLVYIKMSCSESVAKESRISVYTFKNKHDYREYFTHNNKACICS